MHKIKLIFDNLYANKFIKNIGILVGGTAFSQLISLLALPFLTRIYSPNDFSILAVFISVVTLISVVACLRFEIAIPMPKKDEDAFSLLIISLISVLIVTIISTVSILLFSDVINKITQNKLQDYLWFIPLGIFLTGIYTALQYWAIRKKAFALVAKTRMTQAISGSGTQLSLGYLSIAPLGLLIGQLLNLGAGIVGLSKYIIKNDLSLYKVIRLNSLKKVFIKYDRYPKYSTWEAFANAGAMQIPVILIAYYSIGTEAGFVMLAMRLLSAPMGLIGSAIGQVYLSEAAQKYHEGNLREFTYQSVWSLFKLGSIPLLIIGLSAPFLIPLIFGSDWQRAGILITWMAPWFLMQFVTSPVSMALHITNNQKVAMFLQFFGLLFRAGGVLVAGIYFPLIIAEVYAISGLLFYTLYLIIILIILNKANKKGSI